MNLSGDAPNHSDDLTRKFLLRTGIQAVAIFLAVVGGVVVGFNRVLDNSPFLRGDELPNYTYLSVGGRFPDYELWDTATQTKAPASDLVGGDAALFSFVSRSCGHCW